MPLTNLHPKLSSRSHLGKLVVLCLLLNSGLGIYLLHKSLKFEQLLYNQSSKIDLVSQQAGISPKISYKILAFDTDSSGVARINSNMLGYENEPLKTIQLLSYLPYNIKIKPRDNVYVKVAVIDDEIPINQFVQIDSHNTLVLKPGLYYLRTNLGRFRIVVFKKDSTDFERFYYLFYFYSSVSSLGRGTNYVDKTDGLKNLFYSNNFMSSYCTGHVLNFKSLFSDYFPEMRMIDFYGFMDYSGKHYPEGHSILEVKINDKWIMADPLLGFIPFDTTGSTPLSFADFSLAKKSGNYKLKSLFRIPDLAQPIEYNDNLSSDESADLSLARDKFLYISEIPTKGKIADYLIDQAIVDKIWSVNDIIVYYNNRTSETKLFMDPDNFKQKKTEDWLKYQQHYSQLIKSLSPDTLRKSISTNFAEMY